MELQKPDARQDDRVEKIPIQDRLHAKAKWSLQDVAKDFVIFTHGSLFTIGKLMHDPCQQAVVAQDAFVGWYDYQHIFFRNLAIGNPHGEVYERRLFFCDHASWPKIDAALLTTIGVDMTAREFFRVKRQTVKIPDVPFMERLSVGVNEVPMVEAYVYCVDGTSANIMMVPKLPVPKMLPTLLLKRLPIDSETVRMGKDWFSSNVTINTFEEQKHGEEEAREDSVG